MRPQPLSLHTAAETSEACHFVHQHAAFLIKTHTPQGIPQRVVGQGLNFQVSRGILFSVRLDVAPGRSPCSDCFLPPPLKLTGLSRRVICCRLTCCWRPHCGWSPGWRHTGYSGHMCEWGSPVRTSRLGTFSWAVDRCWVGSVTYLSQMMGSFTLEHLSPEMTKDGKLGVPEWGKFQGPQKLHSQRRA